MSRMFVHVKRSTLPLLLVVCLAALSFSYAFADDSARPLAVTVIGDPDAAVAGKFAVGSASVGTKALTVTGVIDFLGAGTVHNYFTQGAGNNMQINTNVDEANTVADASRSQWKLVLGSNLDWFSIRRSPAGGVYNEDALFFIEGSTGNVGIATVDTANGASIPFTPQARLHVETASGDAVRGVTTATAGRGVTGYASATTGSAYGVYGESSSIGGRGVYGVASATTSQVAGVYGQSDSSQGAGVWGVANASSGSAVGVNGTSSSTDGYGVNGVAFATTGANYGVNGRSNSTSGFGVYGANWSTAGWAGYFAGAVHVNGTLTKSAGAFRIDHPLDPANRYLNHSFVESPDMMNIYNGQVTLDDAGEAWVELPGWFDALNQDFRYQLTPLGASMPDLYIAQEIQDNRFLVAGGVPSMQASWQVTGIRHDAYAEAHRIPTEEDKPAGERGTYLYPELYGQPADLAAPQLQAHLPELPPTEEP